jgi:hypothetical protein
MSAACFDGPQVAEMFKLDEQGKAVSVQVFYDLVC